MSEADVDLEKLKALVASLGDDAERAETVRAVRQFRDMAVEFKGMIGLVYVRAGHEDAQERIALLDPASSFFALAQLGASVPSLLTTLLRAEADRDEAVKALEPFAQFAKAFTQRPLYGTGDVIYRIHGGTQWEASISKAACERAASVHARLSRAIDKGAP